MIFGQIFVYFLYIFLHIIRSPKRDPKSCYFLVPRPSEIPDQDHHQNHLKPYSNTIFEGRDRQKSIQGGRAVHFALVKNSKARFWTPILYSCVATKITIYRVLLLLLLLLLLVLLLLFLLLYIVL